MANTYLIRINFERWLEHHFNESDSRVWTIAEIKDWLKKSGFIERPDGWLCEELSLDLFDHCDLFKTQIGVTWPSTRDRLDQRWPLIANVADSL